MEDQRAKDPRIGRSGQPTTMRVELGKIREFARAIKDDNPIYFDEEHAKREAGGVMPPPTFTMTQAFWDETREPHRPWSRHAPRAARRAGVRVRAADPRGRHVDGRRGSNVEKARESAAAR